MNERGAAIQPLTSPEVAVEAVRRMLRGRVATGLFWIALFLGTPALALLSWRQGGRLTGPVALAIVAFAGALVALNRARSTGSAAPLQVSVLLLSLVPVSGLVHFGIAAPPLAGLVTAAVLVTFAFDGRRAALVWLGVLLLLLAGRWLHASGVLSSPDGWTPLPSDVTTHIMLSTLAWTGVAVTVVGVSSAGLGVAMGRLVEALEAERKAQEARLEAERALANQTRLEAVGRLASGVVHDVRNTFMVIDSGLQLLDEPSFDDVKKRQVREDMARSLRAALSSMGELVVFGANPPAAPGEVDLATTVTEFVRRLGFVTPSGVKVVAEPLAEGRANVDRGLLEQALLNLSLNALEAFEGHAGRLRFGLLESTLDGRPALAIEVEDDGPGMPPEVAARAFEPFVSSKERGTGLGLARVRDFATQAGGRVAVEAAPGRGTRFTITLPRAGVA